MCGNITSKKTRIRRSRDRMVVGFTTTYATSAYHHWCCEFESRSGRGVQHYVIKFVNWLATGRWFTSGPPVSSTNKTDRHNITEIVLKVALSTIKETNICLCIEICFRNILIMKLFFKFYWELPDFEISSSSEVLGTILSPQKSCRLRPPSIHLSNQSSI